MNLVSKRKRKKREEAYGVLAYIKALKFPFQKKELSLDIVNSLT
jgi:hypothetical protein